MRVEEFYKIIGSESQSILWWQMVCRGIIIFFYTLILVRFWGQRVFGKKSSFDIVLAFILGSIMSRAMTANSEFFPTLATATTLVALHWSMAKLAQYSRWFGHLVKGVEI